MGQALSLSSFGPAHLLSAVAKNYFSLQISPGHNVRYNLVGAPT